ncbi:MAG: cobalamin biosynthesis protein CbiX [Actinobacteria bacterium]|nr:cobalamin biosynthesis protein CbiX [Actinomycetota bacterium]
MSDSLNTHRIGVIVVDHGSRRAESNEMLEELTRRSISERLEYDIVEPAHMELAEPSIATAFDRCVARGATMVVIQPYFLLPGKHWKQDIPELAAEAASHHPGVEYLVAAPFGVHPLMADVVRARVEYCLAHVRGEVPECEACAGTGACHLRTGAPVEAAAG